jgi:hypothetical protein
MSEDRQRVIYCIFCGDSIYVGRTKDIRRRMEEHRQPPFWAILETVADPVITRKRERFWMEHFESLGVVLLNRTRACGGVDVLSEETRLRLSLANKGRRVTWGDKIGEAQRGMPKHNSEDGTKRLRLAALRNRRTHLRICYGCFRPFEARKNCEQVFCSTKCFGSQLDFPAEHRPNMAEVWRRPESEMRRAANALRMKRWNQDNPTAARDAAASQWTPERRAARSARRREASA